MLQAAQVDVGQRPAVNALHTHQVLFLDAGFVADQLFGDAAVLCQHQQPGGVDVEPAGRCQAAVLAGVKLVGRGVTGPAAGGCEECDCRLVAVFGLAADQTDGLVDQHRDQTRLRGVRQRVDVEHRVGRRTLAQNGGLAAHTHPAGGNPVIGLAP